MRYIICDDNQTFAEGLKKQLTKLEPECTVKVYDSAEQLKFDLPETALHTDAVFMDIKLGNNSGIDEIVPILGSYPNMKVVFITGYPNEYAQEIFKCPPEITPTAFLVKPIKEELLQNALARIKGSESVPKQQFIIKNGHTTRLIPMDAIGYISVQGRKVTVNTLSDSIEMNSTLSECIKQLPQTFVQCHKSYCVNVKHIKEIHSWNEIILTNGVKLPVSRGYSDSFKRAVTAMYANLPV